MNVLIVHPCKSFYGGAEEVVVQFCNYLWKQGHCVRLVTKDAPIRLLTDAFRNTTSEDVRTFRALRRETIKGLRWADIVYCFNFPATLAVLPHDKNVVWYCNEPPELFSSIVRKPLELFHRQWVRYSKVRTVVADTYNALRFQRLYHKVPQVIPYGVDYNFWSQGERTCNPVVFRMLQVGTVTPFKNQLESLRILDTLTKQSNRFVSLTLAGGQPDATYLTIILNEIRRRDLNTQVELLGQQTPEQIRNLYFTHDVLIHPVTEQGGWLAPFEAMCAGIPVVTTPQFPAASLIETNHLGFVTSDPIDTIARLEKFDGVRTARIGTWVRDNLTWERFGEQMLELAK